MPTRLEDSLYILEYSSHNFTLTDFFIWHFVSSSSLQMETLSLFFPPLDCPAVFGKASVLQSVLANETAVRPSHSTTICLMSCQSPPTGRPSPKPRGNQSFLVWILNCSRFIKTTFSLGMTFSVKMAFEDCGFRPCLVSTNLLSSNGPFVRFFCIDFNKGNVQSY